MVFSVEIPLIMSYGNILIGMFSIEGIKTLQSPDRFNRNTLTGILHNYSKKYPYLHI